MCIRAKSALYLYCLMKSQPYTVKMLYIPIVIVITYNRYALCEYR
jgi:hypothetical protein